LGRGFITQPPFPACRRVLDVVKFNERIRKRYMGKPRITHGLYGLDPHKLIKPKRTHVL
jgi:hypothetical protein